MQFNSLAFLIFLPIIVISYWVVPHKYRWIPLLIASYYFYMSWNVNLIVLIMFTTVLSYASGIVIEKSDKKQVRLAALLISVIGSLGVLFFYKYFNFFSHSAVLLFRAIGIPASDFSLKILLPVGISFYTFQTLSYTIDIYRKSIKAEFHFGYYALFVSFFPQLVAGPIERPQNLLPQLKDKREFDKQNFVIGLKYIVVGFVKKVVIADTIAVFVNRIYNSPSDANGLMVIIATVLFALQILCDFDGYTNIAIGVAKLMNINLVKNFNNPYSAKSIKEFWARWHISLSSWFRDYVYIPLGGNRCSKSRHLFNLFITFLLSGLWHGANWTFVIWGCLHALYQILGIITKNIRTAIKAVFKINEESKIWKVVQTLFVFTLVCFAWIFFRANSVSDAFILIKVLFSSWQFSGNIKLAFATMQMTILDIIFPLTAAILLIFIGKLDIDKPLTLSLRQNTGEVVLHCMLYGMLVALIGFAWIYTSVTLGTANEFIYFQF